MTIKKYKPRIKFLYKEYLQTITKRYNYLTFKKKYYLLQKLIPTHIFYHKITIHIKPNNIFYTLSNISKNLIIKQFNTGMLFIKTTRKRIKQNIIKTLFFFFKKIYKIVKTTVILNIIAPKNLKKKIFKQLSSIFLTRQKHILINLINKKCFNGCRPPKKQRKKHKHIILFKK